MQEAAVQVTGVTPELIDVVACESEPQEGVCTPRTDPFDGAQPLHFVAELTGASPSDTLTAQLLRDDAVVGEYTLEIHYRDWLVDRIPFTVAE